MQEYYIKAPYIQGTVTVIKCKAPRHKRAKRNEVPVEYRKQRFKELKDLLFDAKQDIKNFFKRR